MSTAGPVILKLPTAPRYQSLDVWRGVACLSVVVLHSTYYSPPDFHSLGIDWVGALLIRLCGEMWVGVPMFFVISGYCISATIDSCRRSSTASPSDYFSRRFRRIYPPYWVLLGITLVFEYVCERFIWPGLIVDGHTPSFGMETRSAWQWFGTVTLTELWRENIIGGQSNLYMAHAWTLCYEEQFYLVCGLILMLAPNRFFNLTFLISLLVIPAAAISYKAGIRGFFFDGQWLSFYAGILVYYYLNFATWKLKRCIEVALTLGIIVFWCDPANNWHRGSRTQQTIVALAFALALIWGHRWDAAIANSKTTSFLQSCGKMCYSVYLVHWPVSKPISHALYLCGLKSHFMTLLVTIPVCLVASILVGRVFHLHIEQRFLKKRRNPERSQKETGNLKFNVPHEILRAA